MKQGSNSTQRSATVIFIRILKIFSNIEPFVLTTSVILHFFIYLHSFQNFAFVSSTKLHSNVKFQKYIKTDLFFRNFVLLLFLQSLHDKLLPTWILLLSFRHICNSKKPLIKTGHLWFKLSQNYIRANMLSTFLS